MSKKETRRAARQAFPKAKHPPATKSAYGKGSKAKSSGRAGTSGSGVRPPSLRRAVITGIVMAVVYFVLIQWAWASGANTVTNLVIALIAFIFFAGVVYGVDRWKYQRHLRKQKQSPK